MGRTDPGQSSKDIVLSAVPKKEEAPPPQPLRLVRPQTGTGNGLAPVPQGAPLLTETPPFPGGSAMGHGQTLASLSSLHSFSPFASMFAHVFKCFLSAYHDSGSLLGTGRLEQKQPGSTPVSTCSWAGCTPGLGFFIPKSRAERRDISEVPKASNAFHVSMAL